MLSVNDTAEEAMKPCPHGEKIKMDCPECLLAYMAEILEKSEEKK